MARQTPEWTFIGYGEMSPVNGGPHVIIEFATMEQARAFYEALPTRDAEIAEAARRCPGAGPTPSGGWPVSHAVLDAGYKAWAANECHHGDYETFMAVWNAMHRALVRP